MRHESQRALFDMGGPQQPWIEATPVPVRVFAAEEDRLFPPPVIEDTAQLHGGTLEFVPGLAHAMMLDAGWQEAAARIDARLSSLPR